MVSRPNHRDNCLLSRSWCHQITLVSDDTGIYNEQWRKVDSFMRSLQDVTRRFVHQTMMNWHYYWVKKHEMASVSWEMAIFSTAELVMSNVAFCGRHRIDLANWSILAGSRPYFTWDHGGNSAMAIHDHSNNIRTQGLGEFVAVLNGVEFRTRHNDYKMSMPHTTSSKWQAVEDLPQPPVPPEVLAKKSVEAQIKEMQLWFKVSTFIHSLISHFCFSHQTS